MGAQHGSSLKRTLYELPSARLVRQVSCPVVFCYFHIQPYSCNHARSSKASQEKYLLSQFFCSLAWLGQSYGASSLTPSYFDGTITPPSAPVQTASVKSQTLSHSFCE